MSSVDEVEIETEWSRSSLERMSGRFLKGPVALEKIAAAAKLPGQALAVFLAVHHRVSLTKSTYVTLPKALLESFGISRDTKARSLHALEHAQLINVQRITGRAARICLR